MGDPHVIAVVGATATGKTELAEALAERLGAEIVCADSRQVFRELKVGTGRPSPEQCAARPHHVFGALELGARASAGWYAEVVREVCAGVRTRARTPLFVGGSGLYLQAARVGLSSEPPHDASIRARLQLELEKEGPEALHARLARVDPVTAARLAPRDRQRISRALEVEEASGRPLSWWHAHRGEPPVPGSWRVFEIVVDPGRLAQRIERRTRWMYDSGLVEEVQALIETGREADLRALNAVGYDEALELIAGGLSRAGAEERTNLRTRQLAKRQRTWFRHQVEATRVEAGTGATAAVVDAVLKTLE